MNSIKFLILKADDSVSNLYTYSEQENENTLSTKLRFLISIVKMYHHSIKCYSFVKQTARRLHMFPTTRSYNPRLEYKALSSSSSRHPLRSVLRCVFGAVDVGTVVVVVVVEDDRSAMELSRSLLKFVGPFWRVTASTLLYCTQSPPLAPFRRVRTSLCSRT